MLVAFLSFNKNHDIDIEKNEHDSEKHLKRDSNKLCKEKRAHWPQTSACGNGASGKYTLLCLLWHSLYQENKGAQY